MDGLVAVCADKALAVLKRHLDTHTHPNVIKRFALAFKVICVNDLNA